MSVDSVSTLLRALAHERRRHVVSHLARTGSATREELVTALVELEDGEPSGSADRIATSLRHVHLPALDGADLVEYDRTRGEVHIEPADASAVSDLLEMAESVAGVAR